MSEKHMNKFFILALVLLTPLLSFGLEAKKIESTFQPEKCADPKANMFELGQKLITRATASKKTVEAWAKVELESGKDQPELNWIRALNPWILPKDFTSRTAFTECAAHLRTYSDAKSVHEKPAAAKLATDSLEEWKSCLRLVYPTGLPREFTLLQSCLK